MDSNWAAANLQAIRTLMERSAIYRRALAPVMTLTGSVGVVAAIVGAVSDITAMPRFAIYWMCVSLVAIAGDFFLVRRQSLKEGEPFWSPPTRRVSQAMLPALFTGCAVGIFTVARPPSGPDSLLQWLTNAASNGTTSAIVPYARDTVLLSLVWVLLYGCALHSAGFFMPRGIRLFAWAFLGGGAALLIGFALLENWPPPKCGHAIMGAFFGVSQLAYGIYLYFTEQQTNAA